MCRFHKDVARDIATNPQTGEIDPARYAVALVALKYRIEEYLPAMFGSSGYSPYELATPVATESFRQSGLAKPLTDIQSFRDKNIDTLRAAMDATAQQHNISTQSLNLPKDPLRDTAFLDEATVALFDGYTDLDKHWAPDGLRLKQKAHKASFEPLRAAAETFLAQPGAAPILKQMFENSIARIFMEAEKKANPLILSLYQKVPVKLRPAFGACATCSSTVIVPHLPCIALMVAASSSAFAAAIVSSPAIVAGLSVAAAGMGYRSWNRLRGTFAGVTERRAMKAAFALAAGTMIALHVPAFGLHGGHGESHDHNDHSHHQHTGAEQPKPPLNLPVSGDICRTPPGPVTPQ